MADRTRTLESPATEDALVEMYAPFVEAFVSVAAGDRDDTERLIDSARLAIAVEGALDHDETITPNSEALTNITRDGEMFLAGYEPYY